MANVNGVNGGDSTPKIPNTCNFESQQCTASGLPPALNSVWSQVKNSGNCKTEMDITSDDPQIFTTTTTCNGGQIVENDDFYGPTQTSIRVNTGKAENRSGDKFNEYTRDESRIIDCKDQDEKPCQ
jgi:hypothetical protein